MLFKSIVQLKDSASVPSTLIATVKNIVAATKNMQVVLVPLHCPTDRALVQLERPDGSVRALWYLQLMQNRLDSQNSNFRHTSRLKFNSKVYLAACGYTSILNL
jgi:hypothetical protein